jgi:hypothetical protein
VNFLTKWRCKVLWVSGALDRMAFNVSKPQRGSYYKGLLIGVQRTVSTTPL